jgi:hypothetical protein
VHDWDKIDKTDNSHSKSTLCTSCWNRVKPIAKAKRDAQEIKHLIGKLVKERTKQNKLRKSETMAATECSR